MKAILSYMPSTMTIRSTSKAFTCFIFYCACLVGVDTACSQSIEVKESTVEGHLTSYADSLERWLLGHKTAKTLYVADSILVRHSKSNHPAMIRLKAAKANAFELLLNFEPALEIYLDLLPILESDEYIREKCIVYLSLARVYEAIGEPSLCREYLDKVDKLIQRHDLPDVQSELFVRSASHYRVLGQNDKALTLAKKGVELGKKYNVERSVADGNLILGLVIEDLDQSIGHLSEAVKGFAALGDLIGSNFQKINIARKLVIKRAYEEALDLLREVSLYSETILDNDRAYFDF